MAPCNVNPASDTRVPGCMSLINPAACLVEGKNLPSLDYSDSAVPSLLLDLPGILMSSWFTVAKDMMWKKVKPNGVSKRLMSTGGRRVVQRAWTPQQCHLGQRIHYRSLSQSVETAAQRKKPAPRCGILSEIPVAGVGARVLVFFLPHFRRGRTVFGDS